MVCTGIDSICILLHLSVAFCEVDETSCDSTGEESAFNAGDWVDHKVGKDSLEGNGGTHVHTGKFMDARTCDYGV